MVTQQSILPQSAQIAASDYVIFGGTGDLSLRKILPALFHRYIDGQIDDAFRIIAASRSVPDKQDFANILRPFCGDAADDLQFEGFLSLISLFKLDVVTGEGAEALTSFLSEKISDDRPLIFYMAISPSLFGGSCQLLDKMGLVTNSARLVVEKPLGHNGETARQINDELLAVFDEKNIYRIDHYRL